jgi:imidazole glycerol phosphate synthase subunit HisF
MSTTNTKGLDGVKANNQGFSLDDEGALIQIENSANEYVIDEIIFLAVIKSSKNRICCWIKRTTQLGQTSLVRFGFGVRSTFWCRTNKTSNCPA